jgi:hypothetical protein
MSNVLAMPPSLATFIVLNILGWLVQKRFWNPFWVAVYCRSGIRVHMVPADTFFSGIYQYHLRRPLAYCKSKCEDLVTIAH